jgi:hypothetical protein
MSRTWKDMKPEMRLTARRFTERRVPGGPPRDRGESYGMVARERLPRRPGRGTVQEWREAA